MSEVTQNDLNEMVNDWPEGIPTRMSHLIRQNCPQIPGINVDKVLEGHVINRIINEDAAIFNGAMLYHDKKFKYPTKAPEYLGQLKRRIGWEMKEEATPAEIRSLLEQFAQKIETASWETSEGITGSRDLWQEEVFEKVKAMTYDPAKGYEAALKELKRYEDEARARKLPI